MLILILMLILKLILMLMLMLILILILMLILMPILIIAGVTIDELRSLWQLLGSILHMGNIYCKASAGEDATSQKELMCDSMPLDMITTLLGLNIHDFSASVTTQQVKMIKRTSITVKMLTEVAVLNNINAMIKRMYNCIFSWLVKKINFAHCSINEDPNLKATKFIGILDIFGFEILALNSFEQLCINFTNERLQQQFNDYVFVNEQRLYQEECIDWHSVEYRNNQPIIDLIAKKPTGLLILLEEQGMLNR